MGKYSQSIFKDLSKNMCWINWFVSKNQDNAEKSIKSMNKIIKHRWPDDAGFFVNQESNNVLSLWQVRLSIIDLSPRWHQPMWVQILDGRNSKLVYHDDELKNCQYIIVFNWEVYNFWEIKEKLINLWREFESGTDTEVILKAYIQRWKSCVNDFNGMFAFVIWDKTKNLLFISKDKFGKKPFYYSLWQDFFIFSSEIKAIKTFFDQNKLKLTQRKQSIIDFLYYRYIPTPWTIYEEIQSMDSATNLVYSIDQNKIIEEYKYRDLKSKIKETENIDYTKLENLINDAITKRLMSDVPIWLFLSSGVDSNTINYFLDKNKSKVKKIFCNFPWSQEKQVIDQLNIKNLFVENVEIDESFISELFTHFDQPFGDNSSIPTYFINKKSRQLGAIVAFTWDGWDEAFFGYKHFKILYYLEKFNKILPLKIREKIFIPLRKFFKKHSFAKYFLILWLNEYDQYSRLLGGFSKYEINDIIKDQDRDFDLKNYDFGWYIKKYWDNSLNFPKKMLYIDICTKLKDMFLVKADRMSMKNGIEIRSPFLDYRIFEYVFTLKSEQIRDKKLLKKILKTLMKGKLPDIIFAKKHWFGYHPLPFKKLYKKILSYYDKS